MSLAQLKTNPNPQRGDELKAGAKREVDIAQLKTIDLGELELPSVSKILPRERAEQLREQLLRGRNNAALVVSAAGGEHAWDLSNAQTRGLPAGEIKLDRVGPSLLSLERLSQFVGSAISLMPGSSRIHVTHSENGPVVNGQFSDPRLVTGIQLAMFQPPQDPAPSVDGQPKVEKEKLRPEDLQPLSKEDLNGAFDQILQDKDPGARERIGVFYQIGEVIAIPFLLAGKQGDGYSIAAPKVGGAALTQQDKNRIRETLRLADEVGIRETSKISLTGNQTTFTPGVTGGQHGLQITHKGLSMGIPVPVLGVLRREPKPEGQKQDPEGRENPS